MSIGAWEVAVPAAASVMRGVAMVGFRDRSGETFEERILPGRAIGVVIDCTDGSLEPVGTRPFEGGIVSGLAPAPERMSGRAVDCVEVHLDPLAAADLFDVPLADLNGPSVDLGALWGRDAVRLRTALVGAPGWEERFALVHDALARRRRDTSRVDPEVADAWRRITRSRGRVAIGALPARYGWSRARLWRRFTAQVGVSPKRAAMTVRFDEALRLLSTRAAGPARVASDLGYADQAHLTRDMLAFTGRTPGQLAGDPLWTVDAAAWRSA